MRYFRIVLLAVFSLVVSAAQGQNDSTNEAFTLLDSMSSSINKLGDYEVVFSVTIGDQSVDGEYVVGGDNYYMELATAQIYCDAVVRYEVNNGDREIVVDNVDLKSHNLLNNPTRAFDFLDTQFKATLLRKSESEVEVRLDPLSQDAMSLGHIVVRVDASSGLPTSIVYDMNGDSVSIVIESFATSSPPMKFDREEYKNYEWIDFR